MNEEIAAHANRSLKIGQDAIGNTIITGDNNHVVIVESVAVRRVEEKRESAGTGKIKENPYVGLAAFHEQEANRFFGRDKQIAELWEKLRGLVQDSSGKDGNPRLLPILGPSGSGKSSVARAGLIPELARRPLPGLRAARVALFMPGKRPLEALANVLARMATDDPAPVLTKAEAFEKRLSQCDNDQTFDGLRRIADTLPEIASSPLVIFVDQFEEIYSQCDDNEHRLAFIENLLHAAGDTSGHVSVVITLRTDFLGETQRHKKLNALICSDKQHVMIPSMGEEELREAISKPAELAGHPLDAALINQMISDTKDREGALPLLQFALQRIWDGLLKKEPVDPAVTYKKLGGVGGALAGEAQRIYDKLSKEDKQIARRVFLGLVQLGEGTRDTRRRATVEELMPVGVDEERVHEVIGRFSSHHARLITLASISDPADEGKSVGRQSEETAEVTHEALFEHWGELNEWLDENREDIRFSRRLTDTAKQWDEQGRPEGSLWSHSPNLDHLREFHERKSHDMSSLQMDFFIASQQADAARVAKVKRQQLVLRSLLGAAATAAVIAVCMLVWALISRRTAQEGRIDAQVDSIQFSPPVTAGERMDQLVEDCTSQSLHQYAVTRLQSELSKPTPTSALPGEQVELASNKANLVVALMKLGETEEVWPLLKRTAAIDDPTLRSYLIHWFSQAGADAAQIADQLEVEEEPSIRQALMLSLGEFSESSLPQDRRKALIEKLLKDYKSDPQLSVHAAAEWLLRQWQQNDQLRQAVGELQENEQQLKARKPSDTRLWYVNRQGQTMIIIQGPIQFQMGSPESEAGRRSDESLKPVKIGGFAIGNKEITNDQFRRFLQDKEYRERLRMTREEIDLFLSDAATPSLPVDEVDWYTAVAYCNWLTEQEMGKDDAVAQLCYVRNDGGNGRFDEGMEIHPDFLQRTGYRLPTEAEWEYACRAGASTRWSHGESEELHGKYARYLEDSRTEVGRLKPNDFGLFDMHGNEWEWCQDDYRKEYMTDIDAPYLKVDNNKDRVLRGGSYSLVAISARAAARFDLPPVHRNWGCGFRVARTYH